MDQVNKARSRAFIHLLLKVKFGLLNFLEREDYITDGTFDGGVDAYYIDTENRIIFFVQSKFRTKAKNFHNKDIEFGDLLNMDVDRISDGDTTDEHGNKYNGKIQKLIEALQEIRDIGRYRYQVIILANLKKYKRSHLLKLVPGFPCEVFDFDRCYKELVFPVVSGTYYQASELLLNINLANKPHSASRISYPVQTSAVECEIAVLFVPTLEIARNFHKFKNSILRYNPRSYLDLSRNPVNREIARTIRERKTNEFSLFNNGITILSDDTSIQERSGKKGRGQLSVTNPQIINGGQTAYTLSLIYDEILSEESDIEEVFGDKEVMLKIITFTERDTLDEEAVLNLITEISKATNSQSSVKEADRRANDRIQIELQRRIFDEFGLFYERKRGEFYDGIKNKYIKKSDVIDRQIFLRVCYSAKGFPAEASRTGESQLFRKETFEKILENTSQLPEFIFSFICYKKLSVMRNRLKYEKNNRFGVVNYGDGLENGRLAIIFVIASLFSKEIVPSDIDNMSDKAISEVLAKWLDFEDFAKYRPYNKDFFKRTEDPDTGKEAVEIDFFGYYRGKTLRADLEKFSQIGKS